MKKSVSKSVRFFRNLLLVTLMAIFTISCAQGVNMSAGDLSGAEELTASASRLTPPPLAMKPFPQHVQYAGTNFTKPSYSQSKLDSDVLTFYNKWRDMYIMPYSFTNGYRDGNGSGYIIYADSNGHIGEWEGTGYRPVSQSEATGYAMITFAVMAGADYNAKAMFDGMFTIYRNFPCKDNVNLMSWAIPGPTAGFDHTTDFTVNASDFGAPKLASATDGDMDVAYALLLADKQWGSNGRYNYLAEAKKIIAALEDNAIFKTGPNSYYPRINIGDRSTAPGKNYERYKATRSSDWMITHTEAFYDVTGNQLWLDVQNVIIKMTKDGRDPNTGLVSDFYGDNAAGQFSRFEGISDESGGKYDDDYYYNASRFPWRMAMAYAHHGVAEPQQFSKSITDWLVAKFSTGGVFNDGAVTAGYALNGTQLSPGGYQWDADAFNGPFLCGMAVSGNTYKTQITQMWNNVVDFEGIRMEWGSLSNNYFDDTLSLMALLFVSGNWWAPTETAIIIPDPPAAPTGLKVMATTETEVTLDWADNSESNIKEYIVYRKLATETSYKEVARVATSDYKDTALTKSTTYHYVVTAFNLENLESNQSAQVVAKTQGGTTTCTVEPWDRSKVYASPTTVCHGGKHWKSKWWTTGEEPGTTGPWGVWTELEVCPAK